MRHNYLIVIILVMGLTACHRNEFKISGEVSGGSGKVVYLEHLGLKHVQVLDSVEIGKGDRFAFYGGRPEYPDLYRLRIDNQNYVFPIDSTEHIEIKADVKNFSFPSVITGSDNALAIDSLRRSAQRLQWIYDNKRDDLVQQVENHRRYADSLILSNTHSIIAYYAIFQRIGEYYIYNPYNKADRVYCAAVATGFNAYYGTYDRAQSLNRWVLGAIQDEKRVDNLTTIQSMVANAEEAFLEIALPDINGDTCRLSDMKGSVVVLNFTTAMIDGYASYVLGLRELYNKYAQKGLKIYQVSADEDAKLWKSSIENLPWTCVRDVKGYKSRCFITYNVRELPTLYVLNREGRVVARHADFSNIENDIKQCLR